jgi:hypothetical protein
MTSLVKVTMNNGQTYTGLNYRVDPTNPLDAQGGSQVLNIEGPNGWIRLNLADVASLDVVPGKPT